MKIVFLHNILWSKYRIHLFNALSKHLHGRSYVKVIQVALTENVRVNLPMDNRDLCAHDYSVLHEGFYEDIRPIQKIYSVLLSLLKERANLIVVTGFASVESWAAWLFSIVFRRPLILTVDSSIYENRASYPKTLLKRLFLSCTNAVLVYGTSSEKYVLSLGYSRAKIVKPFHSVDPDFYIPFSSVIKLRATSDVRFVFLYVGRLATEKNVDFLIEGFSKAFNVDQSNVYLNIVGDGPLMPSLKNKLHALKDQRIQLLGSRSGDALMRCYLESNCLVLPSVHEPWGLVVNESLCLGTPVLVSDRCGCVDDLVFAGSSSLTFSSNQIDDFVSALHTAKTKFQTITDEIVNECVEISARFSLDQACSSFDKAFAISTKVS